MKKHLNIAITLICAFVLLYHSACKESGFVPSYINVPNVEKTTLTAEGSASHNIRDVWLFVNDNILGVYELPASIPVINEGNTNIKLFAGIAQNGISSNRDIYPMYTIAEYELDLETGEIYDLEPTFQYRNTTTFKMIADFETINPFDESDNSANLLLISDPDLVFEGNKSATVALDANNTSFEILTNSTYSLPSDQTPVYLELDYRCSHEFQVLLRGVDASGLGLNESLIFVSKRNDWNKIYIELSDVVTFFGTQGFNQYRVIFRGNLPDGDTSGAFYWDNIKLLHE